MKLWYIISVFFGDFLIEFTLQFSVFSIFKISLRQLVP